MRQVTHQPLSKNPVISFAFVTALLALFQPIPTVSAQQLIGATTHETGGVGTQGRRTGNSDFSHLSPLKSLERRNLQTSTHKPHRLIRKPQNAPIASVEPSTANSTLLGSSSTLPQSLQVDNMTSQPKEASSLDRSVGAAAPLSTISTAPLSATAMQFNATSTTSTGTTPLSAAAGGNSSKSESVGGRSRSRLAAEMPELTQLISPPSTPVTSINPAIGASPTSLSFTAQQGSSNPTVQTLSISNTGGGTLMWAANNNAPWLTLSTTGGTGNGIITLTATSGTLTAGTYNGAITLTATSASSVTVPIIFTVTAAPVPPALGASPTSFSFTATQGGANPAGQTLSINNTGGGTLSWTASDNVSWLTLSPASGTGNGSMTLSATTGTLATGSYSGAVTLSATGASSVTIPVTFTVAAAPVPPAIGASPTSLSFTASQGGANPANQAITISNTGGGTLSWTVSDNVPWLTINPASGSGTGIVTLSAATGTLATGSHTGTVTLSGGTGVTPVTVPVTFTITAAPNITLSPSSLTYAATEGAANPSNQTVSLTTTGGTLSWTASDNVSWLAVSPASGNNSNTLTASVNTTGLAAGTHTGTITVSAAGVSSKTVAVTLTVNAPATSSAALTWNANTESDLAGYKVYRATASGAYGAPVATLTGNVTNYIATGLQVGTTYFFAVTAYDTAGNESTTSNEVSKSIF